MGKEPTILHHPAHPANVQQTRADPRKSQNQLGFTALHRLLVADLILQNCYKKPRHFTEMALLKSHKNTQPLLRNPRIYVA